jgi:ketosteroid isomerase-like protein
MMFERSVWRALLLTVALTGGGVGAQTQQRARMAANDSAQAATDWTGVYRLDADESDKLYSVVSNASSNLPFGEQQRFFLDLTVRLAPPDQLAIERHGRRVQIASSRAPRITFDADGQTHTERGADGQIVRTRALLANDRLTVTTGGSGDRFTVIFEPFDNGQRLRVTRYIDAPQLNQPIVVRSVYDRSSEVARWEIYDTPETATHERTTAHVPTSAPTNAVGTPVAARERDAVGLRAALDEWIAATNARDIERQMNFYQPTLEAFYLQRVVPRTSVRAEKARVFTRAKVIDIRAAEPEILFNDAGRTAVMRFRKSYVITGGGQDRRGEVIQELRWRRTPDGWRITSERDVKVLR